MMACKYLSAGRTSVGEMENPANSTMSSAKRNFLGLRVMSFTAQICSHSTAWWKAAVMSLDRCRVSLGSRATGGV